MNSCWSIEKLDATLLYRLPQWLKGGCCTEILPNRPLRKAKHTPSQGTQRHHRRQCRRRGLSLQLGVCLQLSKAKGSQWCIIEAMCGLVALQAPKSLLTFSNAKAGIHFREVSPNVGRRYDHHFSLARKCCSRALAGARLLYCPGNCVAYSAANPPRDPNQPH